jgi:hypothetical protein
VVLPWLGGPAAVLAALVELFSGDDVKQQYTTTAP